MSLRSHFLDVRAAGLLVAVMAGAGCHYTEAKGGPGAIEVIASTQSALTTGPPGVVTPSLVTALDITLHCSGGACTSAPDIHATLAKVGGQWSGILGHIPAGDWIISGQAVDVNGNVLYSGADTTPFLVSSASTAVVTLNLQQTASASPFANTAPKITTLYASSVAVLPGEPVALFVVASDPGDTLSYAWGDGTGVQTAFDAPLTATTNWTAPLTPGTSHLTVTVTDSKLARAAVSVDIDVRPSNGAGSATVSAVVDLSPVVENMGASPSLVPAGATTTLSLVADDAEGDAISYDWTSTCGAGSTFNGAPAPLHGTYDTSALDTFTFVVDSSFGGATCTVHVVVTDARGGSSYGDLTLQTGAPPTVTITGSGPPPCVLGTATLPCTL